MPKNFVKLNRNSIEALPPPPPGKRSTYYLIPGKKSEQIPAGFVLIITPNDIKTFYLARRIRGAWRRVLIGRTDQIRLDEALAKAWEITSDIARGGDPAADRRAYKNSLKTEKETTVTSYLEAFLKRNAKRWSARTKELYEAHATKRVIPHLGSRPLASITRRDVAALHATVMAEAAKTLNKRGQPGDGGRTANQVIAFLRVVFNDAIDAELIHGPNPAQRVKLAPEVRRERFLSEEEIGRLFASLEDDAQERGDWTVHDIVKLAVLTGARRENILAMRWENLDIPQRIWRIPATATKTGHHYAIALAPAAVGILQRRREEAEHRALVRSLAPGATESDAKIEPFVFPGPGKAGHLADLKRPWDVVRKRAGLHGIRFHDLRHACASLLAARGVSLQMIGHQLGHRSVATTSRYAHLVLAPVQLAVDAAFAKITGGDEYVEAEAVEAKDSPGDEE